ncbi:MAG: phospholipase D-like domain-containing protein, partial [Tannerella sp.]|jgi:phosphatidylserine/phosphatidylglycerophosphate/cardiolipin synthase-like enzyme|nr:phospholipase D-like domain-containing protein [Tannerella sp.]
MYHKRLTGYAQIGYKALSSKNEPDKISMIYDSDSFVPAIKTDFAEAKQKILIVSPYIRKRQINIVLEWLKVPLQAKLPITIIIRPIESYKEQEPIRKCIELLQSKLTVIQNPDIYQKFIIIDNRLVWYGGVNILDFGNSDDTIMRLESRELVAELETYIK